VIFERPDGTDGFQRAFCQSWEEAEAKVEAEKHWLADATTRSSRYSSSTVELREG
jgi:hypothetical protein